MDDRTYKVLIITERHPRSIVKPFGLLKATIVGGSLISVKGFLKHSFKAEDLLEKIPGDYVECKNAIIEAAIGESFRSLFVPAKILGPL